MYKKYSINENFFDTITNESAYVLGWILTDGCIQYIPQKKYCIRFQVKDKEILEKIRDVMGGNQEIKQDKRDGLWLLIINSKKLVKRLMDLGIVPNKTKITYISDEIPMSVMPALIRGIFDGDGSVSIFYKNTTKRRLRSYICSASRALIDQIALILKDEIGIIPKIYSEQTNPMATCPLYKLIMGGTESYAFYRYIYNEDCGDLYLKRKRDVFLEAQELKIQTGLINCRRCGKEVVKTTKKLLYCPECRKQVIREREAKKAEKRRKEREMHRITNAYPLNDYMRSST